jgi:hypothetical protein
MEIQQRRHQPASQQMGSNVFCFKVRKCVVYLNWVADMPDPHTSLLHD